MLSRLTKPLMVYNIYKFWNFTSWKLQNNNFLAIKVTKRPKHWNRLPKMIICLLPLMWLTWLTWPISTTATPRFFGYCHSNLSMSRKITSSKRIISYGNLIKGLSINYTMRTNLLNWCNLVSISKNVLFYVFLVVRIY